MSAIPVAIDVFHPKNPVFKLLFTKIAQYNAVIYRFDNYPLQLLLDYKITYPTLQLKNLIPKYWLNIPRSNNWADSCPNPEVVIYCFPDCRHLILAYYYFPDYLIRTIWDTHIYLIGCKLYIPCNIIAYYIWNIPVFLFHTYTYPL